MMYAQCQIGETFPIHLRLYENGELAFIIHTKFITIIDQVEEGKIAATFHMDRFIIGNCEDLCYNTLYTYQELPDMLQWLKQQQLG